MVVRERAAAAGMIVRRLFALALGAAAAGASPLAPDDASSAFEVAEGLRIELVASEPLVSSPCAMAFDETGRLFVAENRGYPDDANPPKGSVASLVDMDGDGRMDRRTVFADGLTFPNGVLAWKGGLIVTCAPDVLYLRDTDGDGHADERRVLLTGFDATKSTQLRVNAPTIGPDGWIYLAAGLVGGSITCPEHPERAPLKMTGDVRFHPETLAVENVDGRSQYGMSFDEAGRRFICMNRIQVQHVVLDSKWLRRNPNLAFTETVQNCPELIPNGLMRSTAGAARIHPISANITTADSHQGFFSAACAVTIWPGGALPEEYGGAAFSCDPTGNLVHVDRLVSQGVTFAAVPIFEGKEFLASRDDWFRPVFLSSGPEGALYICDMYRKTIEHPEYLPEAVRKGTDFQSGKEMGRIWRVRSAKDERRVQHASPASAEVDRLKRVIALGDTPSEEATKELAVLVHEHAEDRWMRAACLSGIAGRETQFLAHLIAGMEGPGPGVLELLRELGGCLREIQTLRAAFPDLTASSKAGQAVDPRLAALLLGFSERTKLAALSSDEPWLTPMLRQVAQAAIDRSHPTDHRLLYIGLLGHTDWTTAGVVLQTLASEEREDDVRLVTLRALTAFSEPDVCELLLNAEKWRGYTPVQRETILAGLLSNPVHFPGILAAIEKGNVSATGIPGVRRTALLKARDPAVRERAENLFNAAPPDRQKALEIATQALTLPTRPAHGREIFRSLCASCHRLEREGYAVGPDLFDIRNQTKENILFHIVMPDAEIAPSFATYTVETQDGRNFAGLLASETSAGLTLRMPLGHEERLLRADVAKLEALPTSLMPSGLDAAMSQQDLADLLAFLKGEK